MTENTFDAYMWQILENKQKFISQIMASKSRSVPVRMDDTALSMQKSKHLLQEMNTLKKKMDLDVQVSKRNESKPYQSDLSPESDIAKRYPVQISALKKRK